MSEQIQQISLDLIDDPVVPMRSEMEEEKLFELAASIKTHGLIQPITLRPVGGRYEVVAGHRRFKACKLSDMAVIASIVRELDQEGTDTFRMHENLYREDINPVDEGRYIKKMVDEHGYGPDDIAKITGKSEAYVIKRYELLNYPDYLLQAVELGYINLGSAEWLIKIRDEGVRKSYCKFAITGGLTVKRAQAWYQSWELGALPREATAFIDPPPTEIGELIPIEMPCVICRRVEDIEKQSMQYAHMDCVRYVSDSLKKKQQENELPFP